jgi:hypothetical protein
MANDPASLAVSAQINSGYKADLWLNVTLQPMTKLWKGIGGEEKSDFFLSEEDAREASGAYAGSRPNKFAETLWRLSQVERNPTRGFRQGIREYVVDFPTPAAMGICLANPQLGSGSVFQYYIPNWTQHSLLPTGRTHTFDTANFPKTI